MAEKQDKNESENEIKGDEKPEEKTPATPEQEKQDESSSDIELDDDNDLSNENIDLWEKTCCDGPSEIIDFCNLCSKTTCDSCSLKCSVCSEDFCQKCIVKRTLPLTSKTTNVCLLCVK